MIARGIIHDKTVNLLGVDPITFDERISIHTNRRIVDIKAGWEANNLFPLLINLIEIEPGTGLIRAGASTFVDRRLYEEV